MTLYTGGFGRFVTSTTAPITTGRSDNCRVGFAPTEKTRLFTAHNEFDPTKTPYPAVGSNLFDQ